MSTIKFIHNKVNEIIRKHKTRDPFEICKCMNIKIHYKDLGNVLKAYYFYQSRIRNIIINSNSNGIVRRILCAHELGHAVLHRELASLHGFQEITLFDKVTPAEYEANLFAAELIIPDADLFALLDDPNETFFSIAKELYIPAELLDFKFKLLNNNGFHIQSHYNAPANFLKNDVFNSF